MKKPNSHRARIEAEQRQTTITGILVIFAFLGVLALLTAPTRREYSNHMMCIYGHQEYCL
jgi:hypothetical protein